MRASSSLPSAAHVLLRASSRGRGPLAALLSLVALTAPRLAAAQASADGFDKDPEDTMEAREHLAREGGERMPGEKVKAPPPDDTSMYDTAEDPTKATRFVGMRFRNVILPKFMLGLFADGGSTVNVFMFGPEFSTRKDHTEFDFALQFADYSMNPALFKGQSDGPDSWEEVSSSLKALYLTLDLLYDVPIDDKGKLSFLFGGGVGLGFVAGNLYRNQVTPKTDGGSIDPEDTATWKRCDGPNPQNAYCDDKNDHYGEYTESSWANGGSKPFIFPWISIPQLSLRYKPIKQLQTRVDTGFSLTGFFFGLSAGYAL